MSWTMWHVEGKGFDVTEVCDVNQTDDALQNFLTNHLKTIADCEQIRCIADWIYGHPLVAADYDTVQDLTQSGTVAEIIANIMSEETGIRFSFPGITDDGEDYVVFVPLMPWEMNETERTLTEESLDLIMRSYAEELGVGYEGNVDLVYSG